MAARTVEAVPQRAATGDIPARMPLADVLGGVWLAEGSSSLAVPLRDRLLTALLLRDVRRYKGVSLDALIGWLYSLSNFRSTPYLVSPLANF